ncbi:hypothetical protein CPT_Stills15 [Bacillus phage Stills]|uniref:Uncharacterized protein n=1 Tax=Bacillus phage Stills TaxID=1610833 RepID=A0A0E3XAL2_9CAUD|nr:hypothetical protein CPT_Stills15 [Bacillus phage Stills]AKC02643.1 hypothetical protein CPT_Stills15 [Bacillus phage Stills]
MKSKNEYGHDFLTRPRKMSNDVVKVTNSSFLWRFDKENKVFTLSYLGVANGFLNRINLELCAEVEDGHINKYILRKRVR